MIPGQSPKVLMQVLTQLSEGGGEHSLGGGPPLPYPWLRACWIWWVHFAVAPHLSTTVQVVLACVSQLPSSISWRWRKLGG